MRPWPRSEQSVAESNVIMQAAAIDRAKAELANTRAGLAAARARSLDAKIALDDAMRDLERTQELHRRGVVGAARSDILLQFLIEALTLSLIGGGIGVLIGIAGSVVVARLAEWPMLLAPQSIVVAFGFAALVGVFFGLYPARKAARLNPIEALRYE